MSNPSLPRVRLATLAVSGGHVPEGWGVPYAFSEVVNHRWLGRPDRLMLSVTLPVRDEAEWVALGEWLVDVLMLGNDYWGVSLVGLFPPHLLTDWMSNAQSAEGLSSARLDWQVSPHPVNQKPTILNVSFQAIEQASTVAFLRNLWSRADSNIYDYGCACIAAAFPEGALPRGFWSRPLSDATLRRALVDACGLLLPLDGSLGFLVGTEKGSRLHAELLQLPDSRR